MADKVEVEETPSRGNEWEVVSLTASTYAAAPGPQGVKLNDDNADKDKNVEEEEPETSRAMFMSSHFVFPPNQDENLPLDPETECINIRKEHGEKHVIPELDVEEKGKSDKADKDWDVKGLTAALECTGIQFFDEKVNNLAVGSTEFNEGPGLRGLNLVDSEENVYGATKFTSFRSETTIGGSTAYDEKAVIPDHIDSSEEDLGLVDIFRSPKPSEDDNHDGSHLPCEAWWKRQAACLYAHSKEVNSLWSICIAAAVMGLVVLGHQWQQERWRTLQLKWQFGTGYMKTGRMLGPLSRLKDVIVGGHRRGSFTRPSGSTDC